MSVTNSGVELVGTDQEMAIRYAVSGITTSSTGDALLPTQRMSSILRELQDVACNEHCDVIDVPGSRKTGW